MKLATHGGTRCLSSSGIYVRGNFFSRPQGHGFWRIRREGKREAFEYIRGGSRRDEGAFANGTPSAAAPRGARRYERHRACARAVPEFQRAIRALAHAAECGTRSIADGSRTCPPRFDSSGSPEELRYGRIARNVTYATAYRRAAFLRFRLIRARGQLRTLARSVTVSPLASSLSPPPRPSVAKCQASRVTMG